MKANEAPKKVYFAPYGDIRVNHPITDDDIEYIRTDVFIEKACKWLKENFSFDEAGYCKTNIYSTKSMIYNFKNTLGGKL